MRAASRHVELGGRQRKAGTSLLPVAHQRSPKPDAARGPVSFLRRHALSYFSFKDDIEARIVLNLVVCGNLANVAFVFGRNAAPAIYIARLGAERLARAMFLSGVTIIAFTPRFSAFAKRRRATQVNGCVLRSGAAILGGLYGLLAWCGRGARPPLVDAVVYSAFYVVEDLATLVVMMQNGAVAQELFSATDARRVVGLVQLGSSLGAVFAGLLAGTVAQLGGAAALILAQVTALLVSLWPNAASARLARIRASGPGRHEGDSTSLQRECSARARSGKQHPRFETVPRDDRSSKN